MVNNNKKDDQNNLKDGKFWIENISHFMKIRLVNIEYYVDRKAFTAKKKTETIYYNEDISLSPTIVVFGHDEIGNSICCEINDVLILSYLDVTLFLYTL